jgi:RNA polymerase sigma-70 factor (ECF subfamily)
VDEEDITQSVFADFFLGAREGHYEVPAGNEIWRILLVIALNKIRAKGRFHHAARRDTRKTVGDTAIDDGVHLEHAADRMARAYLQTAIEETIERIPPVHKRIVLLRMEGFEVAEISTKVECPKRSVERALHEFREMMEEVLSKDP